jgi:anthranilate phosphoribosyltransferase
MRKRAIAVPVRVSGPLLDTCGTGGDGADSFNISTVAAIVVAACGVSVAKHGNRAASSKSGSADVLEALGVDINAPAERIARSIEQVGIGFMFSRAHHPAMKHVAPVRAEIGVRTLFNFIGPLTNPANATHQLLGVGDGKRLLAMAEVLSMLGTQGAWIVHGHGGLDEVSLSGPTRVAELRDGKVRTFELQPSDFGVPAAELGALRGGDASENAAIARAILAGERGPKRDAVVVNAGAALCAAGVADSPADGARRAAAALDDGRAQAKLAAWTAFGA